MASADNREAVGYVEGVREAGVGAANVVDDLAVRVQHAYRGARFGLTLEP